MNKDELREENVENVTKEVEVNTNKERQTKASFGEIAAGATMLACTFYTTVDLVWNKLIKGVIIPAIKKKDTNEVADETDGTDKTEKDK